MQYLVIARCGMDDIPMKLCPTRMLATTFAQQVVPETIMLAAGYVFDIDVSIFCNVSVVPINDAGIPQRVETIKDLENA